MMVGMPNTQPVRGLPVSYLRRYLCLFISSTNAIYTLSSLRTLYKYARIKHR